MKFGRFALNFLHTRILIALLLLAIAYEVQFNSTEGFFLVSYYPSYMQLAFYNL
jgi:hypothetical protein